jgi:hypothetical protein
VTLIDLEGMRHPVEVTASTLYEAVALGIMAIREQEWAGKIAEGLNAVEVSVTNICEHKVPRRGSRDCTSTVRA